MCESLSLSQKQIIMGGLLGDAYYNRRNNSIRFAHSQKQYPYLQWKKSFFNENDVSKTYRRNYKEGYVGYSFEMYNRKHMYESFFNFIQKNCYKNTTKKISLKYLNELNALGLAVWWMDDGCLSIHKGNRYGKLCTHCFNYEENILIQKYFHDKWNIEVDIKEEKHRYYFIRLNVTALKKLISIIYKYVVEIPSMIYKIDLDYVNKKSIGDFGGVYYYIKNCKNNFINGTLTTAGDVWQQAS